MIAALFVATGGTYFGLADVDPYDEDRDARLYAGPWPVVAHPPCERWGRYWSGGPSAKVRRLRGDDGGCFAAALASVRAWGGVLEHPEASSAWRTFGLNAPPRHGGWVVADFQGGWTCCVEQGRYGHRARKATWLYARGVALPSLRWGVSRSTFARLDEGFHSAEERRRAVRTGVCQRLSKRQRGATPLEFRDLLISIARSATGAPARPIPSSQPAPSVESGGSGVTETTGDTARTAWGKAADDSSIATAERQGGGPETVRTARPEYQTWTAVKQRCSNRNNDSWARYGGRGISVCQRWVDSFDAFFADMGPRPSSKHSIDRIDNNGNYEPGNCRWATVAEQTANRRPTDYSGENNGRARLSAGDVAEITRRRVAGEGLRAIADDFGISNSQVSRIASGKRWQGQADRPAGGLSASPAKSALGLAATDDGHSANTTGTARDAELPGAAVPFEECGRPPSPVAADSLDLGAAGQGAPLRKRGDGATPETTPAGPAASEALPTTEVPHATGRGKPDIKRYANVPKRLDIRLVGADGTETPLEVAS